MKFSSVQEAANALRKQHPFEHSYYERSADLVFKKGLNCVGHQVYATHEDAVQDWRAEYDCDIWQMAELIMELGGSVDPLTFNALFGWKEET